jgi:hypothetical protein
MSAEDRWIKIRRMVRVAGGLVVLCIALAGIPETTVAFSCEDYWGWCKTAEDCVNNYQDKECIMVGECENPEWECRVTPNCSGNYPVTVMCEEQEET